jgi:hypothetical protein
VIIVGQCGREGVEDIQSMKTNTSCRFELEEGCRGNGMRGMKRPKIYQAEPYCTTAGRISII